MVIFAKYGPPQRKAAPTEDTAKEQYLNHIHLTFNASLEQRLPKLLHSLTLNEFND